MLSNQRSSLESKSPKHHFILSTLIISKEIEEMNKGNKCI